MKVLGRLPTVAVVAVLAMMNTAASRVIPLREIIEVQRTGNRTVSLLDRPSADSAVKLIIQMEAERQQEQSRLLFNPCAYPYLLTHTRLLYDHYYIPYVTSARDIAKWRQSRFLPNYPTPSGVYWVHGFVGPDGYWRSYGRKLNRIPGIEDPSEISDIGWERMLSRIPGVVIR